MEKEVKTNTFGSLIKSKFTKEWLYDNISDIMGYAGLILTIIVFSITTGGRLFSAYNIKVLVGGVTVYAIISLGATFVYAQGFKDVSVGAQMAVYCVVLILILNATNSLLLGFVVILAMALLCGAFNGAVSVWLKLVPIVTSLFLMFVLTGVQAIVLEKTGEDFLKATYDFTFFKQVPVQAAAIAIVGLITYYVFYYTKLGKYVRAIGANELTTKQCGVSTTVWKVLAYMFFGGCVAIGTVFLLARTGTVGRGAGSGYAMDVMLCLILGGMPLSGGMKSKMRSAILGAVTYTLLTNGMILSGVDINLVSLIKSIVFLVIVAISCREKGDYLPR